MAALPGVELDAELATPHIAIAARLDAVYFVVPHATPESKAREEPWQAERKTPRYK